MTNTHPTADGAASTGADVVARHTVLVVEDEEQVRSAVRDWLEQAGYRVLEASGSYEALELVASHEGPIDLMLTDVVMPNMNGWRLTEELAMTHGDIPVIYMSGYPSPVHPFERADGATLLEQPFAPRTLLRAVRTAIDAAAARPDQPASSTDDEPAGWCSASNIGGLHSWRGARLARRDEGAHWAFVTEAQSAFANRRRHCYGGQEASARPGHSPDLNGPGGGWRRQTGYPAAKA